MAYLDTSVIVAYCFEGDPHHSKAVKIVEKLKETNKFFASTLTQVELYSWLSRNIQKYKLPPGIEEILDYENKLRLTVTYCLQILPISIFSDEAKLTSIGNLKLFHKFFEAINLAAKLKLRTLDLLHITYATQLAKGGYVEFFITFDSDILNRKETIQESTGIKIIGE